MEKHVKDTLATYTSIVHYNDLNSHETLFGGKLFSLIDTTSAISVSRFCHAKAFTVAINQMEYYAPLTPGQIINISSFVCGVGTRSIETFALVHGENLDGSKFLVASCFMTYALAKTENISLPKLIFDTKFEKKLVSSYNKRKEMNLNYHNYLKEIINSKDELDGK